MGGSGSGWVAVWQCGSVAVWQWQWLIQWRCGRRKNGEDWTSIEGVMTSVDDKWQKWQCGSGSGKVAVAVAVWQWQWLVASGSGKW
jgi:hypothetical protein